MAILFYNSLTRQKEPFVPLNEGQVRMYNCGPTVYDFPTVGNWRTFVFADVLRRFLEAQGYSVIQVMNLTDVGHMTLTEDQKSQTVATEITDFEAGVDRMQKAAQRENKTVWEVANYYIEDFKQGLRSLNFELPQHLPRATDHIAEQIELILTLEKKGFTYVTPEAVYFDVTKFARYGQLSRQKLEDKLIGARDEVNLDPGKKHPADFRLWQIATPDHAMQWESPWGKGYPGWHIECSAMSIKYLGIPFDIHTGGIDHIPVHHENEIAQSEAAYGKPMCHWWMHGEFLQVDGGRMGKSLGNAYTLHDLSKRQIDPLALRYFFFNAHYRSKQNFTWDGLTASSNTLNTLRDIMRKLAKEADTTSAAIDTHAHKRFLSALSDDFNMPQALAILWEVAKARDSDATTQLATLLAFDKVLGLNLSQAVDQTTADLQVRDLPAEVQTLIGERQNARNVRDFSKADQLRDELKSKYQILVEDTPAGQRIRRL